MAEAVRRNDNAVLTVSSSMLAANELFSYGHRVVFFYCEITVIFLKHRQNLGEIFLKHRQEPNRIFSVKMQCIDCIPSLSRQIVLLIQNS